MQTRKLAVGLRVGLLTLGLGLSPIWMSSVRGQAPTGGVPGAPGTPSGAAAGAIPPGARTAPGIGTAAGNSAGSPVGSTTGVASGPGATASGPANGPPGYTAVARVRKGSGVLPNEQGQIWREYDLSPFTGRLKDVPKPERAVIDWILRDTGTDVWFSDPLGILSADRDTLRVYHTAEMHKLVAGTVDRFVRSGAELNGISLRLATVGDPAWRSRAFSILRPVDVKTPGVQAWLLSKENAAFLLADLARRGDYREHNSPNMVIPNGQTLAVSNLRAKSYIRNVKPRDTIVAGFDSEMGQIDEGFSLEVSPLFSMDGRQVDLALKCSIDQVEKIVPVGIDLPGFAGQIQRAQVQVPQVVGWRLNERFRCPTDQVLLLSCGVVAAPAPEVKTGAMALVASLTSSTGNTGRADALLFVECTHRSGGNPVEETKATATSGPSVRGRY